MTTVTSALNGKARPPREEEEEEEEEEEAGRGREERVKTLSLQEPGSGQIQCTSWRNFAPFTPSTITDIHASARA